MSKIVYAPRGVNSSNISSIGWMSECDVEKETDSMDIEYELKPCLIVEFGKGSYYLYQGVSEEVFHRVMTAESVGRFVNSEVKGKFKSEKLIPDTKRYEYVMGIATVECGDVPAEDAAVEA